MNPYSTDPSQDQDGKEDAFRKATADAFEAPDFGEPWAAYPGSDAVDERDGTLAFSSPWEDRLNRIIACVNACAGMADPAKEIASLKGERDCLNDELSAICSRANAHDAAEACGLIQGMREAIREAYASLANVSTAFGRTPAQDAALAKLQPFLEKL